MMKTCTNIYCKAENPDIAKFCRKCGNNFSVNENMQWRDTSLVKINGFLLISILMLIPLFFVFWIAIMFIDEFSGKDEGLIVFLIILFLIIIIILYVIFATYGIRKTKELQAVSSAIENAENDIRRIMKAGKYGLYNWKKKKVLIPAEYDSIELIGEFYYKVGKGDKYGIYNGVLNRLIVICEYDEVSPFENNMATIVKDDIKKHVDTQGNIF